MAVAVAGLGGCSREGGDAADASPEARTPWPSRYLQERTLAILIEGRQRAGTPATSRGAQPRAIARVPGSRRLVGLVAGDDAIVVLDPSGDEVARADAPSPPSDLAFARDGILLVTGERAGSVARYRLDVRADPPAFERYPDQELAGASSLTSIATAGSEPGLGWMFAGDAGRGAILAAPVAVETTEADGGLSQEIGSCAPPHALAATSTHLAAGCGGEAAIALWSLDSDGAPSAAPTARLEQAGPVLAVVADERWDPSARRRRGVLLAAGGIADGPGGDLAGYVALFAVEPGTEPARLAEVKLAQHGIGAPTFLDLVQGDDGSVRVDVLTYGGDRRAALTWVGGDFDAAPAVDLRPSLPGVVAAARFPPGFAVASPLLGGFGLDGPELTFIPASPAGDPRPSLERLGEALAFTTLIGDPAAPPLGAACGGCHRAPADDGAPDGDAEGVIATRVPSLAEPEPRLAQAALDLFAAANADPAQSPWFALAPADIPWLQYIPDLPEQLSPVLLRYALATYLARFEPQAHPIAPVPSSDEGAARPAD